MGFIYESKFIQGTMGKWDAHYIYLIFLEDEAMTIFKIITKQMINYFVNIYITIHRKNE